MPTARNATGIRSGKGRPEKTGRDICDYRVSIWRASHHGEMATFRSRGMRPICPWAYFVIRIDAIWLATEPMDKRSGTEKALAGS